MKIMAPHPFLWFLVPAVLAGCSAQRPPDAARSLSVVYEFRNPLMGSASTIMLHDRTLVVMLQEAKKGVRADTLEIPETAITSFLALLDSLDAGEIEVPPPARLPDAPHEVLSIAWGGKRIVWRLTGVPGLPHAISAVKSCLFDLAAARSPVAREALGR